jgi:hypothetical protein
MAPAFSFAGLGLLAIERPEAHPPSRAVTGGDFTNGAHRAPNIEETTMLRKFSLVAIAAASLGVAALAPTSASAWGGWHGGWHGGGWHHGWGFGGPRFVVGGPAYYAGGDGCYVRRLVGTPWGLRWRLVNRCY